jgi:hypothetical protein
MWIPGCGRRCWLWFEPEERGDPMSPLRWTTKSTRHDWHGEWNYTLRPEDYDPAVGAPGPF